MSTQRWLPVETRALKNCTFLGRKFDRVMAINGHSEVRGHDNFPDVGDDDIVTSLHIRYHNAQDEFTFAQIYAAIDADKSIVEVEMEIMTDAVRLSGMKEFNLRADDSAEKRAAHALVHDNKPIRNAQALLVIYTGDPTIPRQIPQEQPRHSRSRSRSPSRAKPKSATAVDDLSRMHYVEGSAVVRDLC